MKKRWISNVFLVLVMLAGIGLLLYPSVSDAWNQAHQSRAVAVYSEEVQQMDTTLYDQLLQQARDFNQELSARSNSYVLTEEQQASYSNLLNINGNGVIGYIEIPEIQCVLPIYHDTEESVLQVAVGHIPWSYLPIGGPGTHSVISGHRGLPSARLFTDLDRLAAGDVFLIRILNEVLTYEVDQILIVTPDVVAPLAAQPEQDFCTLVTCTPYGINTHRLLVRGHRIENAAEAKRLHITSDAMQIEPMVVMPVVAAPLVVIFFVGSLIWGGNRRYAAQSNEVKL